VTDKQTDGRYMSMAYYCICMHTIAPPLPSSLHQPSQVSKFQHLTSKKTFGNNWYGFLYRPDSLPVKWIKMVTIRYSTFLAVRMKLLELEKCNLPVSMLHKHYTDCVISTF